MDKEDVVRAHVRGLERCSAMRKKEVLPFAAAWVDLEGNMLLSVAREVRTARA